MFDKVFHRQAKKKTTKDMFDNYQFVAFLFEKSIIYDIIRFVEYSVLRKIKKALIYSNSL